MRLSTTAVLLLLCMPVVASAGYDNYRARYERHLQLPKLPQACNVTIHKPADFARVNDAGARIICVRPGDYTSAGVVKLRADGSAGRERWLIYYDPADAGKPPVNQSVGERAIIRQLDVSGNYWVVHRLTIEGSPHPNTIEGTWNVLDNLLVENTKQRGIDVNAHADHNTIQNSVVRYMRQVPHTDEPCISMGGTQFLHIVNNELYDCTDNGVVASQGPVGTDGLVVENNDIYVTPDYYVDNGTQACTENGVDIKQGGSAANPDRIIHNRMWGFRHDDTRCGGNGSDGAGVMVHQNNRAGADGPGAYRSDYVLIENNIVMDSPLGIASPGGGSNHVSVIGNLLYDIHDPSGKSDGTALEIGGPTHWELYRNTVVDSHAYMDGSGMNNDVRCNVFINSGKNLWKWHRSSEAADNAFFNSGPINRATGSYGANAVVYASRSDARAKPFCFYRKLHTKPERICIPDVVPTAAAPYLHSCSAGLGSRPDMGIDDQLFTW